MAMFDDLVEATPETEADTVKQNLFATEDIQPAHEAEVVNIADSFKTSPEFVRTSFADFQKKHLQPKPEEIDALSVTNPKTTSYMAQSPSMTALMKDKIPQMKSIEDTISEYGFLAKSYKALNAGTASAISGILKFPKLGYDVVANTIVNPIGEKLGFDPVKSEQYFQGGMLNETIKLFDDIAQSESGKVVELQDSILDQASKGNYEGAAKSIYYSTLQSMPNTLTAIVSTMAGNPAYGLASIFASASGSKYEENLKLQKERKAATPEELANKPQISDNEAILNAVSSGSIEVVTERLFGAFNGLKKSITPMVKILTKEAGAESTKQILKQTLKTMASSSAEEGFEEVLASGSNDFADYMMDVNPDALQMKGFVKRMVESGIVGASSGGFMTSPAALGLAYQQKRSIKQAQLNRDTLLAMGPKFNDPKFKEGLPKANRDFVAHTTKGTPLENVGVKIGVFDAYFQEKKLDPAQAAAEMGVSKEYDQAKATGDIVQIPITNWAERVVGTEVERGLIDDIKLKREADYDLSVNEAKEEKAKSVEQFNELQAQEEKQKTIEQSTNEVSRDLENKLSNVGMYAKDEAKAMAFATAQGYRVRSENVYAGRDPLEVYKTEGLKVLGFENTPGGLNALKQESSAPPFFAKSIQLVEQKVGNSATVEQVNGVLKDIKPDERKWMGIDTFLKGKEKVSKQELLDYLRANQLQIEEITKGYTSKGQYPKVKGEAKFSQYQLPGGDNYREVLFRMPEARQDITELPEGWSVKAEKVRLGGSEKFSDGFVVYDNEGDKRSGNKTAEGAVARALETLNQANRRGDINDGKTYKSSHFDETNILAHTRLNDRVDADGKRVLFVEEIQSDWHQAGRKKGYKGDVVVDVDALETKREKLAEEYNKIGKQENVSIKIGDVTRQGENQNIPETMQALVKQYDETWAAEKAANNSLPDAPFRKTWHEFVLKRLIREAAEKGYDKIAWTTGEQQAERYDLSKQVDEIKVRKNQNGTFEFEVIKDKEKVLVKSQVSEADLENHIGKDLAQKATKQELGSGFNSYKGENLKVGGEGMKGFYDKILVDYANKFGKKYGAKVEDAKINAESALTENISYSDSEGKYEDAAAVFNAADEKGWNVTEQTQAEDVGNAMNDDGLDFEEAMLLHGSPLLAEKLGVEVKRLSPMPTVHSLPITPELRNAALSEGFALFQADKTKQVRGFFDPVAKLIGLVKKNANLTTFMHEGGHVWLDQMAQDYKYLKSQTELNPKQEAYLERAETVLKYLEVKSFEEIKTEHHEKWARSFEAYLLEGKAPSERLLKAFKAFETWFLDIYKSIRGLEAEAGTKIELNPEIRDVFDRLLATDEEIQKAQKQYTPLFKDAIKAGMSKELANKWYKVSSEAGEAASALVTKPVMADYQKKQTALYKEERSKVKADLLETLLEMPEQKALTAIETDEQIKSMPVEIQAETFGYPVNDFKKIMDQARFDRTEGVNDLADAEMERRHPDSINELEEAAVEAVHNDKKAEQIRIEAEFLAEKLSDKAIAKRLIERLPNSKILKEEAIHRIALKNVEDIKPYVFERAERAASKEAADAFKKTEGKGVAETEELLQKAFDAKRRELLNHEMFKASIEAQKFVEKKVKEYKKLSKSDEKISAVRDIDYVNAARAVLANYGITRAEKTAEEYLDKVKRYEPKRYEGLINIVKSASDGADLYKKVSFNKFNQMTRAVDALWSLSKSTEQQTIDGVKMKREEVVKSLVDRSTDWVKSKASEAKYASTKAKHGGFKVFGMGIKAALTRIEPWVDFMDNGNPNGIFRKAIWAPVYDASVKYDLKKNEVMTNFKDKLHAYAKDFNKNPIAAGELLTNEDGKQLPFEFANKLELMMAILHRGNQSNLSKLLRGYGWGSEFDGVLDTSNWDAFEKRMIKEGVLTKADYDFAQGVWDMMESFKTDLQKTHKELEGYYFEEVTATEFKNEFGTYKGGYIPAKIDTKNVTDFKKLEEIDIFEKNNPSMAFPTAGAGALKTRNEAFAKRLSLDMNLLGAHIDWALRYTYFEPRVQEVSRLLNDNTFKEELKRIDPNIKEALESWLTRTAQQTVVVPGNNTLVKAIDPAARYLRTSAAMQVMFGNISNTVQQFTGLVVAMSKVKPRYVISGFSHWLTSFSREGNTSVTDMINKSEYMKSVQGTNIFEIQGAINELLANPNAFQKAQDFAVKHTYILQSAAQNIVNTSVWWGAYEQAIAKGLDENTAVQEADSTVRLTQGTNKAIDIAAFEVGSPTYRMFIQFAGYFNMLANLNVGEAGKIVNDVGVRKGGGRLFYLYMTGFMLPAFMSEVMMQAMAGKGFDADDDDEYMDDFLAMFAGSQFKTTTAMVPALGNFGTAAYNKVFTDKIYDDRVNMGLAISTLETLTDFPINLYKDIKNESVDTARTTKDFMSFIGNLSQTPLGALGKPTKYLIDVSKGDVQPTGPVDFTRGIFTGKKGERNR